MRIINVCAHRAQCMKRMTLFSSSPLFCDFSYFDRFGLSCNSFSMQRGEPCAFNSAWLHSLLPCRDIRAGYFFLSSNAKIIIGTICVQKKNENELWLMSTCMQLKEKSPLHFASFLSRRMNNRKIWKKNQTILHLICVTSTIPTVSEPNDSLFCWRAYEFDFIFIFLAKPFNQFMWQKKMPTVAFRPFFWHAHLINGANKNESWTHANSISANDNENLRFLSTFDLHGEWRILVTNFHMANAADRSRRKCSLISMGDHKWNCDICLWLLTHTSMHGMMSVLDAKLAVKR